MQCTEISPKFECQGQRSTSPGPKRALSAADTHEVHANGMRSLKTASSSSGRAHFVAAKGCFQVSSASSMPVRRSAHAV